QRLPRLPGPRRHLRRRMSQHRRQDGEEGRARLGGAGRRAALRPRGAIGRQRPVSAPGASSASSSLNAPDVARTLDRLHRRARGDILNIALVAPLVVPDFFGFRKVDDARLSHRMRKSFLPVSREQGHLLYLVARSIDARRIVEFGTSFGISTIYMAAAVKDNGGGVVVGSE